MDLPPEPKPRKLLDRFGAFTRRNGVESDGLRVGLKPEKGWAKRNYQYVSKALIPTIMRKRDLAHFDVPPIFGTLEHNELEVVWIGHASFLVRTPHHNILIDPNWALWIGPVKRTRLPGMRIDDLPKIDAILISHAHMDHLHRPTLKRIANGQTVFVPKGVSSLLKGMNFGRVHELDLYQHFQFDETEIIFTPAYHWGARMIHDTHRGFGGFIMKTAHSSLYHCGDSAYFEGFTEIGQRYSIDTAILPIGAYDSPSGREVHMNPEEALQAFEDLQAKQMIPMHHETFPLGIGLPCEPRRRLNAAAEARRITDRILSPLEGEAVRLVY
jgi:L-ascorbate metabolism protein UlaG (beta-lactamase superfamily)